MNFIVWSAYAVAILTAGIAVLALWRDRQAFVNRVFALGMALFAVEAGLTGLVFHAASLDSFLFWQRPRFIVSSFLPAVWLVFSLSFARANYSGADLPVEVGHRPCLHCCLSRLLFTSSTRPLSPSSSPRGRRPRYFIRLGQTGYLWHLLWVILSVMILMNLERTFRHATGHMRWQTKFMFLGIGGIFGTHLFTDSQAILFKGVDTGWISSIWGPSWWGISSSSAPSSGESR